MESLITGQTATTAFEHPDATRDRLAAETLYAPRAPAAPLPAGTPAAERMYPPGAPAANGSTPYGKDRAGVINTAVNAAEDLAVALNPAGNTAQLKSQAADLTTAFASAGFDRHDVESIAGFARANVLTPPTEDQVRAHQLTALRDLREAHGPGFDAALSAAKALVKATPTLGKFLEQSKLGNHPAMVLRLAELGLMARARGVLK